MATRPTTRPRERNTAASLALAGVGWALAMAIPLLAAWLASSLAAYAHHRAWQSALIGVVLFPLAPGVWELAATLRAGPGKRALERRDRLLLRTLFLSVAFLVVLLALFPKKAFTALATRGDWMFDGRTGEAADKGRALTHAAARGLEWLYLAAREEPFDTSDKPPPANELGGEPAPSARVQPSAAPPPSATGSAPVDVAPTSTAPPPAPAKPEFVWPAPARLSPLVQTLPAEAEASPATLGAYIAQHEPTQSERARAVHDWVADRIAYDGPAYREGRRTPQDAATVFRTRVGVCAGYARVFAEVAKAAGLEARYVVGTVRGLGMRPDGELHAWNAVKIDGAWALVDTTWDSGHLDGAKFIKEYRTIYHRTPPEAFRVDHLPDEARWQLAHDPWERGEFFRRPMLSAEFFADGLGLRSPERSQVTVNGAFTIELENPKHLFLIAEDHNAGTRHSCAVTREGAKAEARCPVDSMGAHDVKLFASTVQYGTYHYVGHFEVTRF
ncbi:MAG TPA: transglutaminase domain-containing protein [Polyangiaceae bacterium]|nr:transglutaminase domain-containing protein [Polyangiaceae bacterium]